MCHPLGNCHAFRAKPLSERRNLLSQHGILFCCLSSSTHLAMDCVTPIKCSECQSDRCVAALHAGPPSITTTAKQRSAPEDTYQHGEEPTNVTATCTEVCGNMVGGKLCSKICLANIHVNGHRETKIRAYVVIDDQSNCSLAKPKLFDLLELDGESTL